MPIDPAVVTAICQIPRDFRRGDSSPIQLVARSGYEAVKDTLSVAELRDHLERDPALVLDWVVWSEDKRATEGWYFSPSGDGAHVGYVGLEEPASYFSPLAEACAQFVYREVASIHSHDRHRDRTT